MHFLLLDAWEKCAWYACRWMVEENHKAKKTGCRIEDLPFRTEAALQPMIVLLSVTSVMLLNLRQAARRPDPKEHTASAVVAPIYEEVLRGRVTRRAATWRRSTSAKFCGHTF